MQVKKLEIESLFIEIQVELEPSEGQVPLGFILGNLEQVMQRFHLIFEAKKQMCDTK